MMQSYGCVYKPPTARLELKTVLVEVLEGPHDRVCAIKESTHKVESLRLGRSEGNGVKDHQTAELRPSCH